MIDFRKFSAWDKERRRVNSVSVLVMFVLLIPAYFVASQFTSSHDDAVFASFLVAIIIGITFGPLISYFLRRHQKK